MADPLESHLNFFDLVGQPPDVAAERARARAKALGRERQVALASMYSPDQEFQRAGEAQFSRAEGERQGVAERMPESVLRLALEKTSQERQLAALQQQIEYQRGELGLQGQQLGASLVAPLIPALVASGANEEAIKGFAGLLGGHWGQKLGEVLSTKPEAERKSITDVLKSIGLPLEGLLGKPSVPQPKGAKAPRAPAGPTTGLQKGERIVLDPTGKEHALAPGYDVPEGWKLKP